MTCDHGVEMLLGTPVLVPPQVPVSVQGMQMPLTWRKTCKPVRTVKTCDNG